MTINSFKARLTHLVDIVNVTLSSGSRSESIQEDVPARIAERREVIRSADGDRLASSTVVYLANDVTITDQDELIIDGTRRPIVELIKARDETGLHHYEVVVS